MPLTWWYPSAEPSREREASRNKHTLDRSTGSRGLAMRVSYQRLARYDEVHSSYLLSIVIDDSDYKM